MCSEAMLKAKAAAQDTDKANQYASGGKSKQEISPFVDQTNEPILDYHYHVFSLLLMMGYMVHNRKYVNISGRLCAALLLATLVTPYRRLRAAYFAIFQAYVVHYVWDRSPTVANHHNMIGLVCLVLLPQQIRQVVCGDSPGTRAHTAGTLNVVRWVVILMYFFAGFHKINEAFLYHPQVSCAYDKVWEYLDFLGVDEVDLGNGIVPAWLAPAPWFVLIIELVPPILLLFPAWQKWGLLALIKLHWVLLPMGFADFGSIAQSFLVLFVSPTALAACPLHKDFFTDMTCIMVIFSLVAWAYWNRYPDDYHKGPFRNEEVALVFGVFGFMWAGIFRSGLPQGPRLVRPQAFGMTVLALFVFFAMNPYLGLRTAGNLTMFSNLVTEGPVSNHLLLRSNPLKIFSYQDDLVEIVEADERFGEDDDIQPGMIMPRILFERKLYSEKYDYDESNLSLCIRYRSELWNTTDLNFDERFDEFRRGNEPLWQRKFLHFRAIAKKGPRECSW